MPKTDDLWHPTAVVSLWSQMKSFGFGSIWIQISSRLLTVAFCGFKLHTNTVFLQLLVQLPYCDPQLQPILLALRGQDYGQTATAALADYWVRAEE